MWGTFFSPTIAFAGHALRQAPFHRHREIEIPERGAPGDVLHGLVRGAPGEPGREHRGFRARESAPAEQVEFEALVSDFPTVHTYRVQHMLHALIRTEAYGVP